MDTEKDDATRTADRASGPVNCCKQNSRLYEQNTYMLAAASHAQWGFYKFPLYLWLQLIDRSATIWWCLKVCAGFLQSCGYFLNLPQAVLTSAVLTEHSFWSRSLRPEKSVEYLTVQLLPLLMKIHAVSKSWMTGISHSMFSNNFNSMTAYYFDVLKHDIMLFFYLCSNSSYRKKCT